MLYDPVLVERIYRGDPVVGLDMGSRALITRVDARAWGTDPYRRARTLHALLEEFPASAAEVGVAGLDRFFGERAFHDAIATRGSLAVAFGQWLAARAGPVAEIERAVVAIRRAADMPPPSLPTGHLVCAPTARALTLPEGTCARWEGLRAALGPDPLPTLLGGFRAPPRGPGARRPAMELLLVERVDGGEAVGIASEGLHALLTRASRPRAHHKLRQVAVRLGATATEADEVLDDLMTQGLLIRG